MEVLLGTATISDIIKRGDFSSIKEIMDKSRALGMQTFDQALFDLAVEGAITEEEAVKNADSANNLRLKLKLYKDNPGSVGSTATPAAAKPAAPAPVAPPPATQPVEASSWGLELALEEIEAEDAEKPAGQ